MASSHTANDATAGRPKTGNIVLTGFMGTGKTAAGRALAEQLGREFVDTDQLIEARHGSIASIFAERGEEAFRGIERAVAAEIGEREGLVIATGGRMLLDPACERALSANGEVLALTAPAEVILARVLADAGATRPLLSGPDPEATVRRLLAERADGYGRFPQIDTEGCSPGEVADAIVAVLDEPLIRLARPSDVDSVAELLARAFEDYAWTNWAIPADDHVERLQRLHQLHGRIGVARGDLWVCVAHGRIVSAAAWTLIGPDGAVDNATVEPGLLAEAQRDLPALFGDRLADLQRVEATTLRARPNAPYWFLDCVGTDPAEMGQGYATQLLETMLRRVAVDQLPAAVETSTERNVTLYQRLGFEVMDRFDLGEGIPPVWAMTRPTRLTNEPRRTN